MDEPAEPGAPSLPSTYPPQLRAVIVAKDMDRFPVALMPPRWASSVCGGEEMPPPYGPLGATGKAACKRREAEQARESAEIEAGLDEEQKLRRDPAALDRACAATPEARRSDGLAMACHAVAHERDSASGDAMAKDGPKLVAACEATPEARRNGALKEGCERYESVLAFAFEQLLVDDDAGYGLLCPEDGIVHPEDRAAVLDQACTRVHELRLDKAVDRLLADPAALDLRCKSLSEADLRNYTPLASACQRRASDIELAELRRIADDPKAFEARCGRFKRELAAPVVDLMSDDSSEELSFCRQLKELRDRADSLTGLAAGDGGIFADTSSLMIEARARAAAMIATAKAEGAYPKRRPGDTGQ